MKNEKYWKKRQEEKLSSILNDAQVASEYVSDISVRLVFTLKVKSMVSLKSIEMVMAYQMPMQKKCLIL